MSVEEARYRELLGAYVLDGLGVDEEAELRSHLAGCEHCRTAERELREVAAVLPAGDPWSDEDLVPPGALEDRVVGAVLGGAPAAVTPLAPRRRRVAAFVGAAAAAIVVVAGAATVLRPDPPVVPGTLGATEPITFTEAPPQAEVAYANLVAHTWGTELRFEVEGGFVVGEVYTVVFERGDGSTVPAGTFLGDDIPITCELNGALLRRDAAAVTVLDARGEPVLRTEL